MNMRIANSGGRLVAAQNGQWFDVEKASEGRFSSDPQAIYDHWDDFVAWAAEGLNAAEPIDVDETRFETPVPDPRQIMAIGLNYREHARESNMAEPEYPVVFTKFSSSLTGHGAKVVLPSDGVDWEVELVVVIGKEGHQIPAEKAWDYVAGLTIGQDLSWRDVQLRGPAPQFAIAKSFPGFSPVGPYVVTPDELPNKDDLAISCNLDGETLQSGRTSSLIFSVSDLIAYLSQALTLRPGDLIFTGTPSGVGGGRTPKRFLVPGTLTSSIEGIGDLTVQLVD
jgi:2-keto-4-pentenoate hydratase/2-oxohepta-3-ene-1,7-dioic acid hydratase in catechol pathway